jgi:hypothetical protein
MDLMKGTFIEFQKSTPDPEQVAPQLGIVFYDVTKQLRGELFVGFKVVNLARTIIDEANHQQGH